MPPLEGVKLPLKLTDMPVVKYQRKKEASGDGTSTQKVRAKGGTDHRRWTRAQKVSSTHRLIALRG